MHETWFVSDNHFGHQNILLYEPIARPFATLDEMHEVMIERWNSVVRPNDKVYHLGDFAFGRVNIAFASRLNGRKQLVMGNHDIYPAEAYLQYFTKIHAARFWNKLILTHIPIHPDCFRKECVGNVHGHTHSKSFVDPRYFNCSVEQNNLTPINADIILDRFKNA